MGDSNSLLTENWGVMGYIPLGNCRYEITNRSDINGLAVSK